MIVVTVIFFFACGMGVGWALHEVIEKARIVGKRDGK